MSARATLDRAGSPLPVGPALPAIRRPFAHERPAFKENRETHTMKTHVLGLAALLAWGTSSLATEPLEADPLETDPDKYRLVLENERVRVLEYRGLPGDVTHEHSHPDHVVYVVGPAEREQPLPDGTTLEMKLKAGDIFFTPAQTHIGRNTGSVPSHAILVELKEGAGTMLTPPKSTALRSDAAE